MTLAQVNVARCGQRLAQWSERTGILPEEARLLLNTDPAKVTAHELQSSQTPVKSHVRLLRAGAAPTG
jgi:hypothetical protein